MPKGLKAHHFCHVILFLCQIAAVQQAYDGLCANRGTTAVPYFLMKYTDDAVQMASLSDWDVFFKDGKKVLHQSVCAI